MGVVQTLVLLDLLFDRVFDDVVVGAGVLPQDLVDFLHIVSHHVEEGLSLESVLLGAIRARIVLLLTAALREVAVSRLRANVVTPRGVPANGRFEPGAPARATEMHGGGAALGHHFVAFVDLEETGLLFHEKFRFDYGDGLLLVLVHRLLCGVLKDILDHNLNLLIVTLLHIVVLFFRSSRSVALAVFVVVATVVLAEIVLVGSENFHEVKVVAGTRVSVHEDEAIAQSHAQHAIEKLHICLPIQVLPDPFELMESLGAVRLQALLTEAESDSPHVMQRSVDHEA